MVSVVLGTADSGANRKSGMLVAYLATAPATSASGTVPAGVVRTALRCSCSPRSRRVVTSSATIWTAAAAGDMALRSSVAGSSNDGPASVTIAGSDPLAPRSTSRLSVSSWYPPMLPSSSA